MTTSSAAGSPNDGSARAQPPAVVPLPVPPARPGSGWHRAQRVSAQVGTQFGQQLSQASRAPATLVFLVLFWVVAVVSASVVSGPGVALRDRWGAGVPEIGDGRLHTLVTAGLWAPGLLGYLVVTLLALLVLSGFERRWGTFRFVLAALAVQVVGVSLGLGFVLVADRLDTAWSNELTTSSAIGPTTVIAGLVLLRTAELGAIWRRRVRLGLLTVLVTLVLYGGLLQDVLRLSTALTGLVLGILVVRRSGTTPVVRVRASRHERRTLVGVLLAASALGPVLASLVPSAAGPLSVLRYVFTTPEIDPATLDAICADPATAEACTDLQVQLRLDGVGPAVLSVLPAVLVLVLAFGLRRGRVFAWWGAVILHAVLAVLGALLLVVVVRTPTADLAAFARQGGHAPVAAVAALVQPLLLLGVLLLTRRSFTISAPRGTYWAAGRTLLVTTAVAFVAYVGLGLVLRSGFDPTPDLGQLVRDFPARLVPVGYLGLVEPTFLPRTAPNTVLFEWIGIVVWSVAVLVVVRTFSRSRQLGATTDSVDARNLLLSHGDHALSYLTTWAGNRYWFTADRTAYVAYRVTGGVAVTTGDPVARPEALSDTVAGFVEFSTEHGWTPCFYSVTTPVVDVTRALGWSSVEVAEETVLPLGELAFTGKRFQDVRTALNKAGKAGVVAQWVSYPTADRSLTDQVEAISEEWVSDKGMPEMGFTLGGLDEVDDPAVRCVLAVDADGLVHGITSWLPVHRDGAVVGWTLDFMRRRSTGFKGVMEFLIGSAALTFQAEGCEFVSLSGAPLAQVDGDTRSDGVQRVLELLGRTLEPVYGFRSLLAFKAKFQPTYRPLHMAYPEVAALPKIGNAVTRAYLPDLTLRQAARLMTKL